MSKCPPDFISASVKLRLVILNSPLKQVGGCRTDKLEILPALHPLSECCYLTTI